LDYEAIFLAATSLLTTEEYPLCLSSVSIGKWPIMRIRNNTGRRSRLLPLHRLRRYRHQSPVRRQRNFQSEYGIPRETENILGGISTIFWALMVIVSLKYITLIMRADNKGEGGIMALLALASASVKDQVHWQRLIVLARLIGAALFYGDPVLTPAISVWSRRLRSLGYAPLRLIHTSSRYPLAY
jgi:hypothetical protein